MDFELYQALGPTIWLYQDLICLDAFFKAVLLYKTGLILLLFSRATIVEQIKKAWLH